MTLLSATTPNTGGPWAVVDLGSNSFRIEVMALDHEGRLNSLLYLRDSVRLGAGLDQDSVLSQAAMERGWQALAEFARQYKPLKPLTVQVLACQTLREARNREVFMNEAERLLEAPVRVITGLEEAQLVYQGVMAGYSHEHRALVLDIGGRSTELALGHGLEIQHAQSCALGCVSYSLKFFPQGQLSFEALAAACASADACFAPHASHFTSLGWEQAYGASGTVKAVASVLKQRNGIAPERIHVKQVEQLAQEFVAYGHVQNVDWPALKPDRREVLVGGLAILLALCHRFKITTIVPSKSSLRHGVFAQLKAEHLGE